MDGRPDKIVSGGQTGADRAALDVAMRVGIEHGGWCPQGRWAEDGVIPERYSLQELHGAGYRQRTERNVMDSDATLILNLGKLAGGSMETLGFAEKLKKPVLVVQMDDGISKDLISMVRRWLDDTSPKILNVAGPRESKRPGTYRKTQRFLESLLKVDC